MVAASLRRLLSPSLLLLCLGLAVPLGVEAVPEPGTWTKPYSKVGVRPGGVHKGAGGALYVDALAFCQCVRAPQVAVTGVVSVVGQEVSPEAGPGLNTHLYLRTDCPG